MITSNVFQRIFQLKYGAGTGSCFTIDIDDRQYLVTAKHCVDGLENGGQVELFHDGSWKTLPVRLVGHARNEGDISVLAAGRRLSPSHPLPATGSGIMFGQDVYFLGFPFGLSSDSGDLNGGFPLPLVKKATLSAINFGPNDAMLLDGINNVGFSGGPVVFARPGNGNPQYSVAGVVSAYQVRGLPVMFGEKTTNLTVSENTGIIIAHPIDLALSLIAQNPVGFETPKTTI